jgi:hypothetical protein
MASEAEAEVSMSQRPSFPPEIISMMVRNTAGEFGRFGAPCSEVSRSWRRIYLNTTLDTSAFPTPLRSGKTGIKNRLLPEQAQSFRNLKEMANFFRDGPGGPNGNDLSTVELVRITYTDDHLDRDCGTTSAVAKWAWDACEGLYAARQSGRLPNLKWVELRLLHCGSDRWTGYRREGFKAPGMWSLLKLRDLKKFVVTLSNKGSIPLDLRLALRVWPTLAGRDYWPLGKHLPTLDELLPAKQPERVRTGGLDQKYQYINEFLWKKHQKSSVDARRSQGAVARKKTKELKRRNCVSSQQ